MKAGKKKKLVKYLAYSWGEDCIAPELECLVNDMCLEHLGKDAALVHREIRAESDELERRHQREEMEDGPACGECGLAFRYGEELLVTKDGRISHLHCETEGDTYTQPCAGCGQSIRKSDIAVIILQKGGLAHLDCARKLRAIAKGEHHGG